MNGFITAKRDVLKGHKRFCLFLAGLAGLALTVSAQAAPPTNVGLGIVSAPQFEQTDLPAVPTPAVAAPNESSQAYWAALEGVAKTREESTPSAESATAESAPVEQAPLSEPKGQSAQVAEAVPTPPLPIPAYTPADLSPAYTTPYSAPDASGATAADDESLSSIKTAMDELRDEIASMKKELKKKQNSPDTSKKFSCKLGGMLFMDAVMVDQTRENAELYGNVPNEFDIRELRLSAKGEGYGNLSYECTIGVNRGISFKDVFVRANGLPVFGDLRVGYFKVESGMGQLASIYDQTFSEFDTNTNAFRIGRRLGIGSTHFAEDKSARLFLGAFTGRNLDFNYDTKGTTVEGDETGILLNTRVSAVPIYCESGDQLCEVLHVGASYYWCRPEDSYRLRARPTGWAFGMPYLLTGSIPLGDDSFSTAQAEFAWQRNQFAVMTEGFFGFYEGYDEAYGATVQARYMLTSGAYHKYNKDRGVFGEVYVPDNLSFIDYGNMTCLAGPGAWEVAAQWSYTDMDNLGDLTGASVYYGRVNELLAGLTWYWNPQTRICFNWIHSMPESAHVGSETVKTECDTFLAQMRIRF